MRKFAITSFMVLIMLAIVAVPAFAITGNYVVDNSHPYVGLVVFYDADGEFVWRCSGSLISPTKFLTAGHCTDTAEGAVTARVWFQQDAGVHYDVSCVVLQRPPKRLSGKRTCGSSLCGGPCTKR